jgi:hypothetical protein
VLRKRAKNKDGKNMGKKPKETHRTTGGYVFNPKIIPAPPGWTEEGEQILNDVKAELERGRQLMQDACDAEDFAPII